MTDSILFCFSKRMANMQAAESTPPRAVDKLEREMDAAEMELAQKDHFIPSLEHEMGSDAASPLPPPAKVFFCGQLMHHATYNGPEPIAYIDTGLYEGGRHDYYEAYNERDLLWLRRMDYVLRRHYIKRCIVK